jgi:hypothetical protein
MRSSIHPIFPRLQGEEAIDSLQNFIKELENGSKDLTKNQTKALKKVAKGIIASIEAELGEPRIKESGVVN